MAVNFDNPILIAESNATRRMLIKKQATTLGFKTIDTVSNGKEALEKLKERNYDLVISAWIMPGGDGIVLLEGLRAMGGANATIPFIGIFEKNDSPTLMRAINAGMTAFLVSPVIPEYFKKALVKALGEF